MSDEMIRLSRWYEKLFAKTLFGNLPTYDRLPKRFARPPMNIYGVTLGEYTDFVNNPTDETVTLLALSAASSIETIIKSVSNPNFVVWGMTTEGDLMKTNFSGNLAPSVYDPLNSITWFAYRLYMGVKEKQ